MPDEVYPKGNRVSSTEASIATRKSEYLIARLLRFTNGGFIYAYVY
jgi:hypothetical protein